MSRRLMYPHTITIINHHNSRGDVINYFHTIEGVHYQDTQKVDTGRTDHISNNKGYVQIPKKHKGYLPPDQWAKSTDKDKFWTLKEDDKIVKGVPLTDIVEDIEGIRTIESIEDIDYGIVIPHHYGVTLK